MALATLAALAACAAPSTATTAPKPTSTSSRCSAGVVAIHGDADDAGAVADAVPAACARVAGYGLDAGAVDVVIHADAYAFAGATGQDTESLRAWSRYGRVDLLTLASWRRRDADAVTSRLAHELCHVAVWRRCGSEAQAKAAQMPRAWVEGLCSVIAGQGAERLAKAAVVSAVATGRGVDFHGDSSFAYAVAHHVVEGVIACRGDAIVDDIIGALVAGDDVASVVGADALSFLTGCPSSLPVREEATAPESR